MKFKTNEETHTWQFNPMVSPAPPTCTECGLVCEMRTAPKTAYRWYVRNGVAHGDRCPPCAPDLKAPEKPAKRRKP